MVPRRAAFVLATCIAALGLLVATTALSLAAPQPPIQLIVKSGDVTSLPIDGTIDYTVQFEIAPGVVAQGVEIRDNLLHGLDLQLGQPVTLTAPTGPVASIAPTLLSSSVDRKEYSFPLGDRGEGRYILNFQAGVIPGFYTPQSATGQRVTNTATIYVAGAWKGSATLDTPLEPVAAAATERVSVPSSGEEGEPYSEFASISAEGRFVAFWSEADNLVTDDTNGASDIFVRDRQTGVTERVSVATGGGQSAGGVSFLSPSISGNGRFVGFVSPADDLVADDTNGLEDVFVHDRVTEVTQRVSVATGGGQSNGSSLHPSLNADGRFVAFDSNATNLVADDTNETEDVFVHDRVTGATERVSVSTEEEQADGGGGYPSISPDGRFVAFYSFATNLVAGDTNGKSDIFVRDRQAGKTLRVSVPAGGGEANDNSGPLSSIGSGGRFVAFQSDATNLVPGDTNGSQDVFVRDWVAGTTQRVSVATGGAEGNSNSLAPSISSDNRFVAFQSFATNLVPNDTNGNEDIFARDRQTGTTERVSVNSVWAQADGASRGASISADGRFVAFWSFATNLVFDDTNGAPDVFVRDRLAP